MARHRVSPGAMPRIPGSIPRPNKEHSSPAFTISRPFVGLSRREEVCKNAAGNEDGPFTHVADPRLRLDTIRRFECPGVLRVQQPHRQTVRRFRSSRLAEENMPQQRERHQVQLVSEDRSDGRFLRLRTETGETNHKNLWLGRIEVPKSVLRKGWIRGLPEGLLVLR
ncbi:uncharacterized protein LOC124304878 isoform X1 [Neodiprion virginianus]|uniref:uncharacterized protein LOC124304878 isoform X1 n=1 Tax=Neodiprion virginianus TaxID=2961670 RepID=UPI001EE6AC1A|nr:uncharacterized protein LOC124304878 isoform X1 [Neodiprion virginianus]